MKKLIHAFYLCITLFLFEHILLAFLYIPYILLKQGEKSFSVEDYLIGLFGFSLFIGIQRIVNFNLIFSYATSLLYLSFYKVGEKLWFLSIINLSSSIIAFGLMVYIRPYKIDMLIPTEYILIPPIYMIFLATIISPYMVHKVKNKFGT